MGLYEVVGLKHRCELHRKMNNVDCKVRLVFISSTALNLHVF